MCTWEAGDPNSPDRLDALVWALTELIVGKQIATSISIGANELATEVPWWQL